MPTDNSTKADKVRPTDDNPQSQSSKKRKPNHPGAGLASDSSLQPIDKLKLMVDAVGTPRGKTPSTSRQNVHEEIVGHIALLQSDTSKGGQLNELFDLHTKLFSKCKKDTESHLDEMASSDTKTRNNAKKSINRGLNTGLIPIFKWQAKNAKLPNLRDEASTFLTSTLAACGLELESVHSSPNPNSGAVRKRGYGPTSRLTIHQRIVASISAMEKSKSNQPEDKLELENLYRKHYTLFEDYKQVVEKYTGSNNKGKNRGIHLRRLLEDGMTEVLKWRQEHARDESQRVAAGELLKRAQNAGARKHTHIKITNEAILELQIRSLERRKAEWLLLSCKHLEGNSLDMNALTSKRTGWGSWSTDKKDQVEKYLGKEDNGIDKKDEKIYRQRVDDCINFSEQEKRIRRNCSILLNSQSRPELVEQQRSDLLGAKKGDRTLKEDIESVKARWSPCLSAIGDVGLEAGESAEEDDKEEHSSDNEDENADLGWAERPEDLSIDKLIDDYY